MANNEVFIAAKKMINNGKVTSEGSNAKVIILTDDYRGAGEISAKRSTSISRKKWHETWYGKVILSVAGSFVAGKIKSL